MNKVGFVFALLLFPSSVLAYLGPGMGGGAVAIVLGVIGAIFLALIGVIYFPLKRSWLNYKKSKLNNETEEQESS